jgi:hypothetical protein
MVKFLLDAGVNYQVGGSSGFLGQLSGSWVVWVPGSTIRLVGRLGSWVNYQVVGSSGFLGQLSGSWVVWVPGSTIR